VAPGTWHARIEGDKVVVAFIQVERPIGVRYAWVQSPEATLFNGAGLPASPFTTANLDGTITPGRQRDVPRAAREHGGELDQQG